jgi:ABC-2 type transport system permease protein
MKLRRVKAIAKKEFLHVIRDPWSLGMGIVIPMILLVLFGYALTVDVDNVPLVVWDQSQTVESRELVSRFDGSRYFRVRGYAWNYRDMVEEIDQGRALAALVVPRRFAEDLSGGREATVQLIVDGSDATVGTLALSYADTVAFGYTRDVVVEQIERSRGQAIHLPLDVRSRVWYNADLESRNFIVPGLIAVIMMVISALLTSLTVSREWERGTMEQLISTPIKASELVVGKLIPYFAIGMFDVATAVAMGEFVFHVPFRGSLLLLFGTAAVFLIGALSMGMLFSITTRNQLLSSQLAMVTTFLPAWLLSGFVFAVNNMPPVVQGVTYAVPARYFIALLRGIYLKGAGLDVLGGQVLLLGAFSAVMFGLAVARFKKKLT